jgi:glycosyltransferase involved in cell wall biosynthesis
MTLTALQVRGPFRGPSGYDRHTRAFVRELVRQGVAVELIDLPMWGPARLADAQRDPWFDALGDATDARTVLHFAMPHQVEIVPGRLNVDYTMFEATRIPPAWVRHHEAHDLVIVPTESSRDAWIASGVPPEKLRLCPLGIDPEAFGGSPAPLPLWRENGLPIGAYGVRFLNVSELGPRKNLVGLLRAWIRATTRADDAILVVKLGTYAPGWLDLFRAQLSAMQEALGKSLAEAAPVEFVRRIFADDEMPRLYAAATHYISLSFGEGWDQAMCEAAASGLRLIAPDHSAYRAYLDEGAARLLPSREVPAVFPGDSDVAALFDGANWWEPDEEAAIAAIRAAIDGRDVPRRSARDRILREVTWEQATRRLIALLADLEARLT